jgi:hypothetical protein
VRLAARVGLDRRGGLFPKLLHDQEPIGLVYRALDVQNLMAAKKGEMRPFGSHGLVFLDRERERETVSVHDSSPHSHRKPTTSSARSGFTFADPLVGLSEEGLVACVRIAIANTPVNTAAVGEPVG